MQRLEEHVPPPDDPEHALTALAGSNFEREYAALRPSLLRVGDRVSVGGDPATVSRVLHTGHRYDLSIDRTQRVSLDVNGDDIDFSALDLTTHSAQAMPAYRDELLWALRRVVKGYCEWHRKPEAECAGHLKLLHGEWKLADSVALAAQRLWTSLQKVDARGAKSKTEGIEFCSLWSDVIRRDQASLARPSAMLARAINLNLVGAPAATRAEMQGAAAFPPGCHTWRGGGFGVVGGGAIDPARLWEFFAPGSTAAQRQAADGFRPAAGAGKSYRAQQLLATSFQKDTADNFIVMSMDGARELVRWTVELDARGKHDRKFRCKHVNLVTQGHADGEQEYLFSAFSVFTVTEVKQSRAPTMVDTPHEITVTAALDNTDRGDGVAWGVLDLAPWC